MIVTIKLDGVLNPDGTVTVDLTKAVATPVPEPEPFRFGVNLSGGENGNPPGLLGNTHTYPTEQEAIYYKGKGFNTIRVPFKWERFQPAVNGPLNQIELGHFKAAIAPFLDRAFVVILDPHNYGKRTVNGIEAFIGSAALPAPAFNDFWQRLADTFKAEPRVWFNLMNEPYEHSAEQWALLAQSAANAIRGTGAKNKILVPGTAWTGAHSWLSSGNGASLANFNDPGNNFVFEMHQYLDHDSSGTHMDVTPGAGSGRLVAATEWLRARGAKGFLGEFGWTKDPRRHDAALEGKALLDYMAANKDVWVGWAYWAGGDWFSGADTSVEPENPGVDPDHPQMLALEYAMGKIPWTLPALPPLPAPRNLETRPDLTEGWSWDGVTPAKQISGWTRLTENTQNREHRLEGPIYTILAEALIAIEMDVMPEAAGRRYTQVGAVSGNDPWQLFRAVIDLQDGTIVSQRALNGGTITAVTVTTIAGGWKVRVVGTLGTTTRGRGTIHMMDGPAGLVYTGAGLTMFAKEAKLIQPAT